MSSMEELNRKIAALEQEIVANKAKVDAGTLSETREVAIRQQISTDNNVLAVLYKRDEKSDSNNNSTLVSRLFVSAKLIASVFLREMCATVCDLSF